MIVHLSAKLPAQAMLQMFMPETRGFTCNWRFMITEAGLGLAGDNQPMMKVWWNPQS